MKAYVDIEGTVIKVPDSKVRILANIVLLTGRPYSEEKTFKVNYCFTKLFMSFVKKTSSLSHHIFLVLIGLNSIEKKKRLKFL